MVWISNPHLFWNHGHRLAETALATHDRPVRSTFAYMLVRDVILNICNRGVPNSTNMHYDSIVHFCFFIYISPNAVEIESVKVWTLRLCKMSVTKHNVKNKVPFKTYHSALISKILCNKTDVGRRETLGHPSSINPNMINHVPNNHLPFCKSNMLSEHEAIKISYSYHLPCQGSRNCQS